MIFTILLTTGNKIEVLGNSYYFDCNAQFVIFEGDKSSSVTAVPMRLIEMFNGASEEE
jgi:hypothetical protein